MSAYYNDNDPYVAQWLRNLIAAGHIAPGDVDERSIVDVRADDLVGYDQCHFFAGIGGWSRALRLAGQLDSAPVWTGSCPCQPFSTAGQRLGFADRRHLWPHWFRLIRECRPSIIFGEQVEAAIGWGWLDVVFSDLEAEGYAVGAAVLPACSVGAPHIRQRCWFVADADATGRREQRSGGLLDGERPPQWDDADGRSTSLVAEPEGEQHNGSGDAGRGRGEPTDYGIGGMELTSGRGWERGQASSSGNEHDRTASERQQDQYGLSIAGSHWSYCDWLSCTDGKARPVEPGTFPLASGIPNRVGRLRAYGNAITPQCAQAFIEAVMEKRP